VNLSGTNSSDIKQSMNESKDASPDMHLQALHHQAKKKAKETTDER
jgi:hypothetical protein